MVPPQSGSSSTDSRWNLEMLVFVEGRKPENPEKNPRSKDENQQQTQPTCDTGTQATALTTAPSPTNNTMIQRTDRILNTRSSFV